MEVRNIVSEIKKQIMAVAENIDVRDEILIHLTEIERNVNWLATKTGYSYDTLHSCLKKKSFKLTDKRLKKINKVLNTKF